MFDKREIRKVVESYADGNIDENGIVRIVKNVVRQLEILAFDIIRKEVKDETKEDNSNGKSKHRRNWFGI